MEVQARIAASRAEAKRRRDERSSTLHKIDAGVSAALGDLVGDGVDALDALKPPAGMLSTAATQQPFKRPRTAAAR